MKFVLAVVTMLCMFAPALAERPAELTLSVSLNNPNDGFSTWNLTGEYLIGAGPVLLIGPSISMFDAGAFDGSAFGLAGEFNIGKQSGIFARAAIHKLGGNAADVAALDGSLGVGYKIGDEGAFFKGTVERVWMRTETGVTIDPDTTRASGAIGWRF